MIGAQKSGTTSLFAHLASHPDVVVPPEKEAPFFSHEPVDPAKLADYLADYFAGADERLRWGTVTPQYMNHPGVSGRIAETFPTCRLIAVLRHPIERALSHHQMMVKRGGDDRSADDAILEQLDPAELEAARHEPDVADREECGYVVRGEYGRILATYLSDFPREQLLVLFLDEMEADPTATWRQVATHLGIDTTYIPRRLDERRHVGGSERKVTGIYALKRSRVARAAWRLVPTVRRRRFRFWFDQWNVKAATVPPTLSPQVRDRLVDHFRPDVRHLETLLGREVPWIDLR